MGTCCGGIRSCHKCRCYCHIQGCSARANASCKQIGSADSDQLPKCKRPHVILVMTTASGTVALLVITIQRYVLDWELSTGSVEVRTSHPRALTAADSNRVSMKLSLITLVLGEVGLVKDSESRSRVAYLELSIGKLNARRDRLTYVNEILAP